METKIDRNWNLFIDPADSSNLTIARTDGKFFRIEIDKTLGYAQPVVRENTDQNGLCGAVIPIVRLIEGEWHVAVSQNKRLGTAGFVILTEASRASVDNWDSPIDQRVIELGAGRSNSARIIGEIRCGVLVVDASFELAGNANWITFADFAKTTDMMGQAAIFRFLFSLQM